MAAKQRTLDVLNADGCAFSSLLLSENVLQGLEKIGFKNPSPVQLKSIPFGKCGLDLIVQAKSGTGKTCVFAVIALEMVLTTSLETQAIILAPTREIAAQISEVVCEIGSYIDQLHCQIFIGGTSVENDKKKVSKCQIAIGTPGRIKRLIESGLLASHAVRLFILDEADKLLEPGSFQDQINWIYSTLPKNKQILALSATYPEYLAKHLMNYMNEPAHIRLDTENPTLLGIKQVYVTVAPHHLPHVVFEQKAEKLAEFLRRFPFQQCIVFSNYHARAQMLADMLSSEGWPLSCISGNQSQVERFDAMKKLKDFKCRVLISTDLTSRGIDCDKVDLVVNLDMPWDTETYLHRVGRAGRFGNYGLAVSFVTSGKEESKLLGIADEIKYKIELISDLDKVGDIPNAISRCGLEKVNDVSLNECIPDFHPVDGENDVYDCEKQASEAKGNISASRQEQSQQTNIVKFNKHNLSAVSKSGHVRSDSQGIEKQVTTCNQQSREDVATDLSNNGYDFTVGHEGSSERSGYDATFGSSFSDSGSAESLSGGINDMQGSPRSISDYRAKSFRENCSIYQNSDIDLNGCSNTDLIGSFGGTESYSSVNSIKKRSRKDEQNNAEERFQEKPLCNVNGCYVYDDDKESKSLSCNAALCLNNFEIKPTFHDGTSQNQSNFLEPNKQSYESSVDYSFDKNSTSLSPHDIECMMESVVSDRLIQSGMKMLHDYYAPVGVLTIDPQTKKSSRSLTASRRISTEEKNDEVDLVLIEFQENLVEPKARLSDSENAPDCNGISEDALVETEKVSHESKECGFRPFESKEILVGSLQNEGQGSDAFRISLEESDNGSDSYQSCFNESLTEVIKINDVTTPPPGKCSEMKESLDELEKLLGSTKKRQKVKTKKNRRGNEEVKKQSHFAVQTPYNKGSESSNEEQCISSPHLDPKGCKKCIYAGERPFRRRWKGIRGDFGGDIAVEPTSQDEDVCSEQIREGAYSDGYWEGARDHGPPLNWMGNNRTIGIDKYRRLCKTWYQIYHDQAAWISMHSWFYQQSKNDFENIYNHQRK